MCPTPALTGDSFSKTITRNEIAAYLVNCLVPSDSGIRLVSDRIEITSQSCYQLDYVQGGVNSGPFNFTAQAWLGALVVVWSVRLALLWRKRVRALDLIGNPEIGF